MDVQGSDNVWDTINVFMDSTARRQVEEIKYENNDVLKSQLWMDLRLNHDAILKIKTVLQVHCKRIP